MPRLSTFLICIVAAAASFQPLRVGAADEDTRELVRRVAETYNRDRFTMQCTSVLTIDVGGMTQVLESSLTFAADGPGRRHLRLSGPLGMFFVSNGDSTWIYMALAHSYGAEAASFDDHIDGVMLVFGRSVKYFATLDNGKERARALGAETIKAGGRAIDCRVVEVSPASIIPQAVTGPDTLWIDPTTGQVVRSRSYMVASGQGPKIRSEATYEKIDFGHAPDSLFVFTPPRGARRADSVPAGGGMFRAVDLTGTDAVDFELLDAEGKTVSLSSYRGRVVVVDFWATWCVPCRLALPDLATLQKEFEQQGLIVLAISSEGSVAHEFLRRNDYGLHSLHDVDGVVAGKYQVKALPSTLIIGKDGKIVAHTTGRHPISELRAEIVKAGPE